MTEKAKRYAKPTPQSLRLRQARILRGFDTASKACKTLGWNYNSYLQHELGWRSLSRSAKKYAQGYNVSESWLLTGEGVPPLAQKSEETSLLMEEFIAFILLADLQEQKLLLHFLQGFSSAKKK